MKLIATKSYSYDTRRLKAGDEFDATDLHARILVGVRKARYAAEPVQPVQPVHVDEIEELRARAERLGIQVDRRWGAYRLRQEIMQANHR